MQTLRINVMAQECYLWLEEGALLELDIELVLLEKGEDDVEMLEVVFNRPAEYQNVIQVDNYKCVQMSAQHVVHCTLKGSRRIGETHGHHKPFILAISSNKRGLVHIFFLDLHLPVSRPQIQACKVLGTCQTVNQVLCSWNRELILDGSCV